MDKYITVQSAADIILIWKELVIYQGLPSKARLAKNGLSDGLCRICNRAETMKHCGIVSFPGVVGIMCGRNIRPFFRGECIGVQFCLVTPGLWFILLSVASGTVWGSHLCLSFGKFVVCFLEWGQLFVSRLLSYVEGWGTHATAKGFLLMQRCQAVGAWCIFRLYFCFSSVEEEEISACN